MKYSGAPNQNIRASPEAGNIPTQYYAMPPQYSGDGITQAPAPYFLSYPTHTQYASMYSQNEEENATTIKGTKTAFRKKIKASSFREKESDEEDKEFEIYKHASKFIDDEFDSRLNLDTKDSDTTNRPNAPIEVDSLNQNIWNKPNEGMIPSTRIDPSIKGVEGGVKIGISQVQEPPGFSKVQQKSNPTLDST